ncbi:A24 family peptidase [Streptosporangium sp. NPDC002524]|uniref:A24 family peptidase n=1 Tax=Streptosporangium sp. NPDC002524 TaxID=3154537 RepID=UPI0033259C70
MSPPVTLLVLPALAALAGLAIGSWTRRVVARHSWVEEAEEAEETGRAGAETVGRAEKAERTEGVEGGGAEGGEEGERAERAEGAGRERRGTWPPAGAVEGVTAVVLAALTLRALWPDATPGVAEVPGVPGAGIASIAGVGELLAFGWLAVVAVALSFVDAAVHRLPDRLTLAAYLGTAAPLAVPALADGRLGDLLGAGLGGLALAGFYLALFLVNPAGMGLGDVKFAASLGTALGWLGWDTLVTGAFLGLLAGGLYGAVLMAARRAGRKSEIPFGPFMAFGTLAAVLTAL